MQTQGGAGWAKYLGAAHSTSHVFALEALQVHVRLHPHH